MILTCKILLYFSTCVHIIFTILGLFNYTNYLNKLKLHFPLSVKGNKESQQYCGEVYQILKFKTKFTIIMLVISIFLSYYLYGITIGSFIYINILCTIINIINIICIIKRS
jgi:hypothetical protein